LQSALITSFLANGGIPHTDHIYDLSAGPENYAPHYVRAALSQ
jgi:hypothetical protein